jgi:hypothetical protein
MKNKILSFIIPLMLLINYNVSAQAKGKEKIIYERNDIHIDDSLPNNLVPNKQTVIKIAEAIWLPIYGKEIYNEKPFVAEFTTSGIWIVKGSLQDTKSKGGVAYIETQKSDCKILKIFHGK